MKKLILTLAIATSLIACSKPGEGYLGAPNFPETWFGRVRVYYQPTVYRDTVWRLRMIDADMKREFEGRVGYVYDDHLPQYIEVGQMWEVKR